MFFFSRGFWDVLLSSAAAPTALQPLMEPLAFECSFRMGFIMSHLPLGGLKAVNPKTKPRGAR